MKKIVILPLLILAVSSVFGMDLPKPLTTPSPVFTPTPLLATLKAQLQTLKDMREGVLNGQVEMSDFQDACVQVKDSAVQNHYQEIAQTIIKMMGQTQRSASNTFKYDN